MLAQVENTLAPDGTRVVIVREPIRKSVKLQVLLDRFDEYIRSDFPGRRESSIECSKSRALKWLSWMKRNRVIEVNAQVVADYANHLAKCGDARSYVDSQWTAVRRYMRWIERQDLLEATAAEWQRLDLGSESERQLWLARLATLWPDVAPGDKLVFYVDEQGAGHFWLRDRLLGSLDDPAFAPAFLAIWLTDDSRDPALTRRLRGQS